MKLRPRKVAPTRTLFSRALRPILYVGVSLFILGASALTFFVFESRHIAAPSSSIEVTQITPESAAVIEETLESFPVSVNPVEKEISEDPALANFIGEHIAPTDQVLSLNPYWFTRALGKLALMGWYQNLASLSSRILVVESGERKEQVAEHFGKILKWDAVEKKEFLALIETTAPVLEEGKLFPGAYTVSKDALPGEVAALVLERFNTEVLKRYPQDIEEVVPLSDALTIASLLEREARDFDDMRHISGVIWNRLFTDMRLQIDATLQYAKGSKANQPWWPRVVPDDKYLSSAYNTYKNEGLPPTPIANASLEAITAALNPIETECMYYFHDKKGGFHCSVTYEEHVASLKEYYGRGK
ncbi:endolytic transglycosylase MltG [Candidatus Kaiserbacteria bacterium]|nr:MAG: endolytic transglycosylase MltG [Candidatus Kaiserbacteria bacterium]